MPSRNAPSLVVSWGAVLLLACGCDKSPTASRELPPSSATSATPSHHSAATATPAPTSAPASRSAPASTPIATPQPAAATNTGKPLRLVSWNMEWLNADEGAGPTKRKARDYKRLAEYVKRLDAQLFAVQEVDGIAAAQKVFDPQRYDFFMANQALLQRVGFVVAKGIAVTHHRDLETLDVGGVRAGVDITITVAGQHIRLLAVHLKSGCFDGPLDRTAACQKLAKQIPPLEAWIDTRQREGTSFAVVGDFNRHFFKVTSDVVWSDLDDGDPQDLMLWSPTEGKTSHCRHSKFPHFVDHLVLSAPLKTMVAPHTFKEHVFDPSDSSFTLSDHCPISIDFVPKFSVPTNETRLDPSGPATTGAAAPPAPTTAGTSSEAGLIKGNIASSGKKLYHLPHCPGYKATRIDQHKGERFFATEVEARAAGWVKAGNCR